MTQSDGVSRLGLIEQNLQQISTQKQQFQGQLFELESALREVESSAVTYKLIAGLLVSTPKEQLRLELNGKKDLLTLRIQTFEKQEKQLKEKAQKLQQEVLSSSE